jgi:serine/threonine-protein kinase
MTTPNPNPTNEKRLAATLGASEAPSGEVPHRPYLAGEVIADRYRLQEQIGRGGMGVVWVAHSLVLGIDVAVKLIRADIAGDGMASRMAREAHAAARLGHPALVRVFDFGWTNRADPFLVMELVQGDTLASVIKREGSIRAIRAVQILLPIADGLRLAHERSIVHRDIKPDNILLSTDALGRHQPKLLDFGIAKVGQKGTSTSRLTQMGAVLGSPEYMSPEQALGLEDIDARTDVWSLSVALYEMLTGRVPFDKPNYNALMQAIINEQPVPTSKQGEADGSLWTVLKKGLEKDRDQRWANMAEFGEALALWLYEHGIKEDLSGNSIRAVWLDHSVLSSEHPEVPSYRPPARTLDHASSASNPEPTPQGVGRESAATLKQQAVRSRANWASRFNWSRGGRARLVTAGSVLVMLGGGYLIAGASADPAPSRSAERPPERSPEPKTSTIGGAPTEDQHAAGLDRTEQGEATPKSSTPQANPTREPSAANETQRAAARASHATTEIFKTASEPESSPAAIGSNRRAKAPVKRKPRHDFGF